MLCLVDYGKFGSACFHVLLTHWVIFGPVIKYYIPGLLFNNIHIGLKPARPDSDYFACLPHFEFVGSHHFAQRFIILSASWMMA